MGNIKLKRLVGNFVPFNAQEEEDKRTIINQLNVFDDVLTRKNVVCHFTSSTFIVNKEKTKALMVHHNIFNSWAFTGGHNDGCDDCLVVAKKEAKEETDINNLEYISDDIFTLEIIPIKAHYRRGEYVSSHIHFNVTFLAKADENEKIHYCEGENSAVKWIDLDKILSNISEKDMIPIYQKILAKVKETKI